MAAAQPNLAHGAQGTPAAGAALHFRRVPATLVCRACGHSYSPRQALPCPACGSEDVRVTAGEEFYLEAIDISGAAEPAAAAPAYETS